jgi:hypothetical protein
MVSSSRSSPRSTITPHPSLPLKGGGEVRKGGTRGDVRASPLIPHTAKTAAWPCRSGVRRGR